MKKIKILCLLLSFTLLSCEKPIEYRVKVTYCDGREPKIITVNSYAKPCNDLISNYKRAVPEYHGELNVCAVEVVK
jgi:hypothetical protein